MAITIVSKTHGTLTVHAATAITHTKAVEATQFPVEKGPNITDHLRTKPDKVTIEGWIGDHEMSGKPGDVVEAYRFFDGLHKIPELVTVTTELDVYTDMALVNVPIPEKPEIGSTAINFTAEFQFITLVDIDTVTREVKKGAPRKKPPAEQNFEKIPPKTGIAARQLEKLRGEARERAQQALRNAGKKYDLGAP